MLRTRHGGGGKDPEGKVRPANPIESHTELRKVCTKISPGEKSKRRAMHEGGVIFETPPYTFSGVMVDADMGFL